MRLPRCAITGTLLLLACAVTAAADPITLLRDGRSTSAAVFLTDASGSARQNLFQHQSDILTTSAVASTGLSSGSSVTTLTSTLPDPMHWSGAGTATASWTIANNGQIFASSSYDISFLVTAPVFYQFDSSSTSSWSNAPGDPFQGGAEAATGFSLYAQRAQPDDPEHPTIIFGGFGPKSGLLIPDVYFFNALASGFANTGAAGSTGNLRAAFNFTFDLRPADTAPSPTPEPASLLLLGSGITGICASRARRRQG
jgi:hypothetical protein